MAINPVSDNYHGFIFDGENSRNYGVYITKPAVFNSPERDVEYIAIPGRNGDYALDKGRFKNITVSYACAVGGGTEEDFSEAVSAIRNMLASRKGYKRLTDEINTGEYRMACFSAGIDISALDPRTGTFTVEFMCKPQRFLTSGETAETITSGGTITNPTPFESSPLIEAYGYGEIDFNGEKAVEITTEPIGELLLAGTKRRTITDTEYTEVFTISNGNLVRSGDSVTYPDGLRLAMARLYAKSYVSNGLNVDQVVATGCTGNVTAVYFGPQDRGIDLFMRVPNHDFTWGTADSFSFSVAFRAKYVVGGTLVTDNITSTVTVAYDGANTITFNTTVSGIGTRGAENNFAFNHYPFGQSYYSYYAYANSTMPAIGEPIYIDTEIGQAWKEEGGSVVSVNNAVILPVDLPVLAPGDTNITFDNTFTQIAIVPRWWKI